MRAVVVVFFVLCLAVPSIADIQCGGPENKKCDSNHFCCGDKSMKRPSPDEQGTAPHGLTKSHCLDFATPPSEERAALRKHKKMICPDKEFRQFNGEQPDAIATRVPLKRPKNRQRSITPLVAGISWGFHEDPFYCTLGAVLCAKSGDKSKRYFVANQHCVDENLFEDIGVVKEKLDKHIALQPSINAQDEVDNAKAKKPAPVGRFVFGERNWVEALGTFRDTAIIELDPQVPVKARVMVEDNPNRMKQQTKRVLGFKTFAEIEALKKAHPDLKFCISGRTGGWGCFPVRAVEDKAHEGRAIVMENAHGSENINPQFLYGGNSGSVFWYKDPKEDGYWAVGLFSGHPEIDPMEDVLASVKAKSGLDLTVCTHDAMPRNAAYKKGNKVKHF